MLVREISLPGEVSQALERLERAGWEAWAVGGCVRDSLLRKKPADWDLCTDAPPEETLRCFAEERCVTAGIKHGTVAVWLAGKPVEITTYRVEGAYSDCRRPDTVAFTRRVEEDLARRDFTVNSMAYHPARGLQDPFGGWDDLERGLLRCVGDPAKRFGEDALRLLRALRFSACLGFFLEEGTEQALRAGREGLRHVAAERALEELRKLLCGEAVGKVLRQYGEVLGVLLPELVPMMGFPALEFDVYEHTVRSVEAVGPDFLLRMTMLLHDIARPFCFQKEGARIVGYEGHCALGAKMADRVLARLRADGDTRREITRLIALHDGPVEEDRACLLDWLAEIGEGRLQRLIQVLRADLLGQQEPDAGRLAALDRAERHLDALLAEGAVYSLGQLAVSGRELIAAGFAPGPGMGEILRGLLASVMGGETENSPPALLKRAEELRGFHPKRPRIEVCPHPSALGWES